MSAFFVAPATIDAAVAAFIAHEGPLSLEAATALGRALWALNAEAVRWRYNLDTGSEAKRAEHAASVAEAAAYEWTPRDLTEAVPRLPALPVLRGLRAGDGALWPPHDPRQRLRRGRRPRD